MGASIHSDLYIKNSFINIFHLYVPCRTVQLNFFLNSYIRFNFDWSLQYNIFIHNVYLHPGLGLSENYIKGDEISFVLYCMLQKK